MAKLIDKDALVAEIERRIKGVNSCPFRTAELGSEKLNEGQLNAYNSILSFIDTLEVIDPYEQCIQYPSVKDGIEAHAETYSFNIESELFNQLTKEQQALWRKEIEQACISGGGAGYELAKDPRYKENLEMKEVNLQKEMDTYFETMEVLEHENIFEDTFQRIAKHFFELGVKAKQGYLL